VPGAEPALPRVHEARFEETETGIVVQDDGWFVLNLADVSWESLPNSGVWCNLGSPDVPFGHFGIGVHILMPGQANGRYHAESNQEGFLVLAGECIAVVEGEERRLGQWDYLHCPPWTTHITIGAGDGPCAILMVGARSPEAAFHYPVSEVAARHGAAVARTTD
jgi:mannose-6-phosphate isomerase-like protein (cupin superfamily)